MRRLLAAVGVILTVAAVVAAPAAARGSDPLLSGYAGPGGGAQAILGSDLLPGARQSARNDRVVRSLEVGSAKPERADAAASPGPSAASNGSSPPSASVPGPPGGSGTGAGTPRTDERVRRGTSDQSGDRTRRARRTDDERAAFSPAVIGYPATGAGTGGAPVTDDVLGGLLLGTLLLLGIAALSSRTAGRRRLR